MASCQKENVQPNTYLKNQKISDGDISNMRNRFYSVESWRQQDFNTGEDFELLGNHSEVDSIYAYWSKNYLLIVYVDYNPWNGLSFYKKYKLFEEYREYTGWELNRDQFHRFPIQYVNSKGLQITGMHSHHMQSQRITIKWENSKDLPKIIKYYENL